MSIANKINEINAWIEKLLKRLDATENDKAEAIKNYDAALALAMIKLRYYEGEKLAGLLKDLPNFPDISVKDINDKGSIPSTLIPKIAAGLCYDESLKIEKATSAYKSLITKIESTCAMLNSQQSIFRHLSHEVK